MLLLHLTYSSYDSYSKIQSSDEVPLNSRFVGLQVDDNSSKVFVDVVCHVVHFSATKNYTDK